MFLRPRRQPRIPYPAAPRRGPGRRQPQPPKASFLSFLQDSDGNFDFAKITATAQQLNGIYSQVSPMISKFIKR